jgi:hypothetical protein
MAKHRGVFGIVLVIIGGDRLQFLMNLGFLQTADGTEIDHVAQHPAWRAEIAVIARWQWWM